MDRQNAKEARVNFFKKTWRAIERGVAASEYPIFALSCPTLGAAGDVMLLDGVSVERSGGRARDY